MVPEGGEKLHDSVRNSSYVGIWRTSLRSLLVTAKNTGNRMRVLHHFCCNTVNHSVLSGMRSNQRDRSPLSSHTAVDWVFRPYGEV